MNWADLESILRTHAQQQPRGFQATLAQKLEIKPSTVAQALSGKKRIPPEWLGSMLELLNLEMTVHAKQ